MTYVWSFNDKSDMDFIEELVKVVKDKKGEVYFVELISDLEERLSRLENVDRKAAHKVSSLAELKDFEEGRQFSSDPEYFKDKNYILLNTSELPPDKCALAINKSFQFTKI